MLLDRTDMELAERVARLIYRSLLGIITPEEERDLQAWRKESKSNEVLYTNLLDPTYLELEYKKLKSMKSDRPMADMTARLRLSLHRRRQAWMRWGVAAVVVLAVGTAVFYLRVSETGIDVPGQPVAEQYVSQIQPGRTEAVLSLGGGEPVELGADTAENRVAVEQAKRKVQPEEAELCRLETPRGGEFKITLEDSTEVWLNAETQLMYPERFGKEERRVVLKGEAYFKVARDTAKPFYVESNGQVVRVYGTEFNVRSYTEDADVYTTLVEGRVSLQPLDGSGGELVLTPGRQAVFDKASQMAVVRPVDTRAVTSWRKGRFVFEEQRLEQVMQDLARWYNFEYEFESEDLKEIVFMGSVPRYGDFGNVLAILEKSGGLKFKVQDRTVFILGDI